MGDNEVQGIERTIEQLVVDYGMPSRRPVGYLENFDNLRQELEKITEDFGQFPKAQELKETDSGLYRAIVRYHGGIAKVRKRLGVKSLRRAYGYWKDIDNIRKELDKIITDEGEFPTVQRIAEFNSALLDAIRKHHGGMNAIRGLYDVESNKSPGYWKDFDNVEIVLRQAMDDLGHFPSSEEMKEYSPSLPTAIHEHHGGINEVREKLGIEMTRRPNTYWQDIDNVKTEVDLIIKELGRFPSLKEIRERNRALESAIRDHYNGINSIRKVYGKKARRKNGYWHNPENIKEHLDQIIGAVGRFPTQDEISEINPSLSNAIGKYHGGLLWVSKWYEDVPATEHHEAQQRRGYWNDIENVKKELEPIIEELGRFPTQKEIAARNSALPYGLRKHGGLRSVKEKLGYETTTKEHNYWQDFGNVKSNLEPIIEELGRFPTYAELREQSSPLVNGIERHHGGYTSVKVKLGYVDEEMDILREVLESLSQ